MRRDDQSKIRILEYVKNIVDYYSFNDTGKLVVTLFNIDQ